MNLDDYQTAAAAFSLPVDCEIKEWLAVQTLGLAGEAGEVTEHVKKYLLYGRPLDREALDKELGDVLWYISELCTILGLSLEQVAENNIEKLRTRYPEVSA
jgi:NTP pyrophosphatase (non-canonical NTP hydrolase)